MFTWFQPSSNETLLELRWKSHHVLEVFHPNDTSRSRTQTTLPAHRRCAKAEQVHFETVTPRVDGPRIGFHGLLQHVTIQGRVGRGDSVLNEYLAGRDVEGENRHFDGT